MLSYLGIIVDFFYIYLCIFEQQESTFNYDKLTIEEEIFAWILKSEVDRRIIKVLRFAETFCRK